MILALLLLAAGGTARAWAAAPPKKSPGVTKHLTTVAKSVTATRKKTALPPKPTPAQRSAAASAEETHACVQGTATDLRLVNAFLHARDPLVESFRRYKAARPTIRIPNWLTSPNRPELPEVLANTWVTCARVDEQMRQLQRSIDALDRTIQPPMPTPKPPPPPMGLLVDRQIRQSCVDASLRRISETDSYYCASESGQKFPTRPPGPLGPCISSELAEYLQYAVTQAIECLSQPGDELDPRVVLKKVNNESQFHFYQAATGGVGFGQLTSIAVKQLVQIDPAFMLRRIVYSPNKACDPFKPIIQQELMTGRTPLPSPNSSC